MCTATWRFDESGYDLLFNRDERRSRSPGEPPRRDESDGICFLAPRDSAAGGTWIGVNDHGVSIFLLTYIMPKFTPLFTRKGVELPKITAVFMQVSDYLIDYWYAWVILSVLSVIGFYILRRTDFGRRGIDSLKISLPILGPTFRKVIISRGIRTFGTMLKNGVPMLDALQLTADDPKQQPTSTSNPVPEISSDRHP